MTRIITTPQRTHYDYLIVGAGLFGAVFAQQAQERGKTCLIVERRNHIAGNCYTENIEGIDVHRYGAHIFHTSDKAVWEYVNRFAVFNNFVNSPVANFKGKLFNLPFNMNTFYAMWGTKTPTEAMELIERQRRTAGIQEPRNLEEQAISLVGRDIYEMLIRGYTEKQWGRPCSELPANIIKRLPVRLTFDNNYFNDRYQGIPVKGYTSMVEAMIGDVEVMLEADFLAERKRFEALAGKVVYTGAIDEYFGYEFGPLNYRSVRFETEVLRESNHQGVAVINYTEREIPYTRVIEHKHFNQGVAGKTTVISREYPSEWSIGEEPYYPVNDAKNNELYRRYRELADKMSNVIFGGRLGSYRYYDMDRVIALALQCFCSEMNGAKTVPEI